MVVTLVHGREHCWNVWNEIHPRCRRQHRFLGTSAHHNLDCVWFARARLLRRGFQQQGGNLLSKYIPGYATYRTMAEEKLRNKVRMLPYSSALIKQQEYWRPAYLVEQDADGNCVVFLPETPDTSPYH